MSFLNAVAVIMYGWHQIPSHTSVPHHTIWEPLFFSAWRFIYIPCAGCVVREAIQVGKTATIELSIKTTLIRTTKEANNWGGQTPVHFTFSNFSATSDLKVKSNQTCTVRPRMTQMKPSSYAPLKCLLMCRNCHLQLSYNTKFIQEWTRRYYLTYNLYLD